MGHRGHRVRTQRQREATRCAEFSSQITMVKNMQRETIRSFCLCSTITKNLSEKTRFSSNTRSNKQPRITRMTRIKQGLYPCPSVKSVVKKGSSSSLVTHHFGCGFAALGPEIFRIDEMTIKQAMGDRFTSLR